jgi:hypothetical protein
MRIFYDTEFLEDGRTIDLISIGMVAEDGREYYAVSKDATKRKLRRRIRRHPWLMANVVPSLPKAHGDWNLYMPRRWLFNYSDPCVKPRHLIAREVRDFILAGPDPQLWAWYGAYDHVALCQLWGRMIDLPDGVPMWTNDLKQEAERLGNPEVPEQASGEHNALSDARHNRVIAGFLAALSGSRDAPEVPSGEANRTLSQLNTLRDQLIGN